MACNNATSLSPASLACRQSSTRPQACTASPSASTSSHSSAAPRGAHTASGVRLGSAQLPPHMERAASAQPNAVGRRRLSRLAVTDGSGDLARGSAFHCMLDTPTSRSGSVRLRQTRLRSLASGNEEGAEGRKGDKWGAHAYDDGSAGCAGCTMEEHGMSSSSEHRWGNGAHGNNGAHAENGAYPVKGAASHTSNGAAASPEQVAPEEASEGGGEERTGWGRTTEKLTELSTFPFLLLLLPQVLKNTYNLMAGNPQALSIIAWQAYTNGLLGNLLLLSYFCVKGEKAATIVQGIGVVSITVLLAQIYIAGHMPGPYFWGMASIVASGVILAALQGQGRLPESLWHKWQTFLAIVGSGTLSHALWTSMGCASSLLPVYPTVFLVGTVLMMDDQRWLPEGLHTLCDTFYAWTATLLFMAMPIAQLVNNFTNPLSLQGLSIVTVVLGFVGNSLTIPRALFTRDIIWFTGCTWGAAVMGWGQLLSFHLAGIVSVTAFASITLAFLGYIALVLYLDYNAQKDYSHSNASNTPKPSQIGS